MPNVSAHLRAIASFAVLLLGAISCLDDEGRMRKRIAGDYAREFGGDRNRYFVRHVLTLREDGTWVQTSTTRYNGRLQENPPDSGTYRIVDVTVNLRSLVVGGAPSHYTIVGDTLFSANATMAYKFSGDDIGEDTLVRLRPDARPGPHR